MESAPPKLEVFSKAPIGYTLHIVHLLTVIAQFALCIVYFEVGDYDDYSYEKTQALMGLKAFIVIPAFLLLVYCCTFIGAPRFAIKGHLFWKTSPFLFSGILVHGIPFFTEYYDMQPALYWTFFPLSLILFISLYVGVYLRMDSPLAPILRPYVCHLTDNTLSGGMALDQAVYGPPLVINNSFKGQPPVTMRFGSHAVGHKFF